MNLLAIETSSAACSIALQIDGDVSTVQQILPMQQAKYILPLINDLLAGRSITIQQIDAIAFGCGPGSFTGVRIATSIAQGLAYAIQCPVLPVSSLAALAQTALSEFGWRQCLVAVDARVKEIYWGAYEAEGPGPMTLKGLEHLSKPQELTLTALPYLADFYGIGNAWDVYGADIPYRPQAINVLTLPIATGVLAQAHASYLKKAWQPAMDVKPVYLRNDIAD